MLRDFFYSSDRPAFTGSAGTSIVSSHWPEIGIGNRKRLLSALFQPAEFVRQINPQKLDPRRAFVMEPNCVPTIISEVNLYGFAEED